MVSFLYVRIKNKNIDSFLSGFLYFVAPQVFIVNMRIHQSNTPCSCQRRNYQKVQWMSSCRLHFVQFTCIFSEYFPHKSTEHRRFLNLAYSTAEFGWIWIGWLLHGLRPPHQPQVMVCYGSYSVNRSYEYTSCNTRYICHVHSSELI